MSRLLASRAKSGTCAAAISTATSADLPSMTCVLWGIMLPGALLLPWSSEIGVKSWAAQTSSMFSNSLACQHPEKLALIVPMDGRRLSGSSCKPWPLM